MKNERMNEEQIDKKKKGWMMNELMKRRTNRQKEEKMNDEWTDEKKKK